MEKYFIKYKTMAGTLFQQGHTTKLNYDVYFWLGIEQDLRHTLEHRIDQLHPERNNQCQYSVREINEAGEWYFRRNRAETMVVNAADYGVDLDSGTTDAGSEDASSDSDSDDSDYEVYRVSIAQNCVPRKKRNARKRKSLPQFHLSKVDAPCKPQEQLKK
jgi:hypothetical protein